MGFDTLYFRQIDDDDLIDLANTQQRIILTRDRELSERRHAQSYLLKSVKVEEQLRELIGHFGLRRFLHPFSRCLVCNTPLEPVEKSQILDRLPPKVQKFFDEFEICRRCDRLYWHGDHYREMEAFIQRLLTQ